MKKIDQMILPLCVRILQDTCQAASCDAAAKNEANVQTDHENLFILNVYTGENLETKSLAEQEIAAHTEGGRRN